MIVNLISVSSFKIDGIRVAFFCGCVFLYLERATPYTKIFLGVRHDILYMLLGQPMIGSSGLLDLESMLESWLVARERDLILGTHSSSNTLIGLNKYELKEIDA